MMFRVEYFDEIMGVLVTKSKGFERLKDAWNFYKEKLESVESGRKEMICLYQGDVRLH